MTSTLMIYPTKDKGLPWIDYSTLSAVNTCPRWGLVHSYEGKRLQVGVERAMPLEAGRAMHEVFAVVRIFDLLTDLQKKGDQEGMHNVCMYAAYLFKNDHEPTRWNKALDKFYSPEDDETRCIQMALILLETSGFHDHPQDSRRTQSNLEVVAINYIQRYPLGRFIPLYEYKSIHVGVEIPFDVTLQFENMQPVRYIGRIDAACHDRQRKTDSTPEVQENKTGARIDTVWSNSFETSHQVTGYLVALSTILEEELHHCTVWGSQIPLPKSSLYGDGQSRYPVTRDVTLFAEWAKWVRHTLRVIHENAEEPWNAPMYTHSCNRYFRSCSLIPFCTETQGQREHIFKNEMTTERWNPLEGEAAVLQFD